MNALQIKRVEDCMNDLIEKDTYVHSNSINYLVDRMSELATHLAFVNNQMAIAKKILNEKKVAAYNTLISSQAANEVWFSPSQGKDYISAKLSEETYNYQLCERCSRTIVHQIDALRTAISALKNERDYGNS